MAAPTPVATCRTHPGSPAGWTCEGCSAPLCPQCVAEKRYGTTSVVACLRCGGHAVVLTVHRSRRSYASRLVGSLRLLARPFSLLTIVVLAVFNACMDTVGGYTSQVLSAVATWGWFVHVFFAAARGLKVEVPDFASIPELLEPPLRGLASSFYVWGPMVMYAGFVRDGDSALFSASLLSDPVFLLILGWGLFYAPIAFIAAASDMPFPRLFNPVALLGLIFTLGTDYFIALGVLGGFLGIGFALGELGGVVSEAQLPVVSSLVPRMLSLIMPTLMAHVLGLLLYVHGDKVGYGLDSEYYEPALPGVPPQGKLPGKPQEPGAPERLGPTA